MKNVYDGQNYVTTYPFGPYVYHQDSAIKHGYSPSNSTCYYDTTVPLHQPEWCSGGWLGSGHWGNGDIGCDAHYSITSLSVSGSSWTKATKIPTAIGALTNLQSLQITNAGLSGPIPSSLGGLSRLTNLNLQSNMLTASVPTFVANVWNPSLENNCNLTSSIPAISYQVNTYSQGTCNNDRQTIAAEGRAICKIAKALSSIRISDWNGVTYVPKPVFSNSYYGDTSLRYGYNPANSTCYYNTSKPLHTPDWCNYWSGIGCSYNKVTSLQIYSPSWTNSVKMPRDIGSLTNLQTLIITYAGLSGSIPNFIGLTKLNNLQLYGNRLSNAVPTFINTMTTRPNSYVNLQTNCNLTWTSTSPVATSSTAYYGSQGNCPPLKPGKHLSTLFLHLWSNLLCSYLFSHFPYTRILIHCQCFSRPVSGHCC